MFEPVCKEPQRLALFSLGLVCVLLLPMAARGDTIATVTLSSGGPDQTLPLGSAFYLEGDASDASLQSVGAVFVEYSYNVWNVGAGPDCAKIAGTIGALQLADDPQKPGTPLVFRASPATTTLGKVWVPKAPPPPGAAPLAAPAAPVPPPPVPYHDVQNMRALVTGAWTRAASTDKQFKFLVGASFFRSGARYCMFAYQRKNVTTDQTSGITKAVADWVTKTTACGQCASPAPAPAVPPPAAPVAGAGAACTVPTTATLTTCQGTATAATLAQISKLLLSPDDTSPAAKSKADASAGAILAAAGDLSRRPRDILKLTQVLAQWPQPAIPVPDDNTADDSAKLLAPLGAPAAAPSTTRAASLFATIAARLLVREGVFDFVPPAAGAGARFYYEKGAFDVQNLRIEHNYTDFRAFKDPAKVGAANDAAVGMDPKTVILPGSQLSLLDLIMLAKHQLYYGSGYVDLAALQRKVSDSLTKSVATKDPTTATQDASLTAFGEKLRAWDALLKSSKPPQPDDLHTALYEWLTQYVLEPCASLRAFADDTFVAPAPAAAVPKTGLIYCLPAGGPAAPPPQSLGFSTSSGEALSPFEALADQISDDARDLQRVAKLSPSEIQSKAVDSYVTSPMDVSLQLTQKAFFTTYVTPIVGYAAYLGTRDSFWEPDVGIDVYLFPNPVDEPMWTNGSDDLRRLFAVELAVAPVASGFGPGGRYTTVNGIPPFFIGGAFQVLPYVTLSTGCAVLGTRPPEVPQASTKVIASPYVGLSVQANVPDIVRALANGGSNTTTTNGAGK